MSRCLRALPFASSRRSLNHAWPFAVAKATQVCTRNRTSPVAVEESPSSRDPTTRSLRRSPRHPWLSLRRRCMSIVWCGDTPVILRSLGDRCERHRRASRAWSARWPASPKGRIESEPRGPSQLRGVRGVARIAPSQFRIVMIRHGLKVSVLLLPCVGHHAFWLAISEPGWTSRKKVPLGIRLKSTRPS